jgi:hypothetical protein
MVKFVIKAGGGTMKKLIFALLCTIILTACGGNGETPKGNAPENIYVSHRSYSFIDDGMFFKDPALGSRRLMFLDFNSMNSVPVCPKPNCPHTDESACSAIGMSDYGTPFYHNDKLFYFIGGQNMAADGKITAYYRIMTADLDGSNRRQLYEISGIRFNTEAYVIADDVLYFVGNDMIFAEINPGHIGNVNLDKHYLFEFNLKTHRMKETVIWEEGYDTYVNISGVFDDDIYISVRYMDYELDESGLTQTEIYETRQRDYIYLSKRLDLSTGKIHDSDLPYGIVTQDRYIWVEFENEENLVAYMQTRDGKKTKLDGFEALYIDPLFFGDNKCLSLYLGLGWDFTQNKLLELSEKYTIESGTDYGVVHKHKDDYIVEHHTDDGVEFIKLTEKDIIKG